MPHGKKYERGNRDKNGFARRWKAIGLAHALVCGKLFPLKLDFSNKNKTYPHYPIIMIVQSSTKVKLFFGKIKKRMDFFGLKKMIQERLQSILSITQKEGF